MAKPPVHIHFTHSFSITHISTRICSIRICELSCLDACKRLTNKPRETYNDRAPAHPPFMFCDNNTIHFVSYSYLFIRWMSDLGVKCVCVPIRIRDSGNKIYQRKMYNSICYTWHRSLCFVILELRGVLRSWYRVGCGDEYNWKWQKIPHNCMFQI